MHIKSCYVATEIDHLTRYQDIHNFKAPRKGVIQDYYEKIKASISSLQNKSYAVIESTINRSSKSITSSNDTNVFEISSFRSASNITNESNARSNSNASLIYGIGRNAQE